jgi:hypothetical protein
VGSSGPGVGPPSRVGGTVEQNRHLVAPSFQSSGAPWPRGGNGGPAGSGQRLRATGPRTTPRGEPETPVPEDGPLDLCADLGPGRSL